MVLPPSEVQGEELLRSVAHFQRQMLKKREEQGRLLPTGAKLEPKSAQDKGTGQCRPSRLQQELGRPVFVEGSAVGGSRGRRPDGGLGCSAPADGRGSRHSGR